MYRTSLILAAVAMIGLMVAGCSGPSQADIHAEAKAGTPVTAENVLGKWDLDGEKTNTANGKEGILAIPGDIIKDTLGDGWLLESGGVLKVDDVVGSKTGSWTVSNGKLTVQLPGRDKKQTYKGTIMGQYMYLEANGEYRVFHKNKFFGM